MNLLEQGVPSLKLCKKLKELSFPQEGLWYWVNYKDDLMCLRTFETVKQWGKAVICLAPTLGQMMLWVPQYLKDRGHMFTIVKMGNGKWWMAYPDANGRCNMHAWAEEIKPCDALSKLLICLRNRGLIKPEELK